MKKKNAAAKRSGSQAKVSESAKVAIRQLPTGVRGLDEILGGGIPEFSFNIIAGTPGCGKTTLAHQIVFANATPAKPALYFTVLGEPAMKMLRYQQQFSFFDESKLGKSIRLFNLADVVMEQDLEAVLAEIVKQVTTAEPRHRGGGFLSHRGAHGDERRERGGAAGLHPAPRAVPHQLGGDDLPRW
jgi:circadian clock protein KaiC